MAYYLTEADVRQVLTMGVALDAVEHAMKSLAAAKAVDMPRQRTRLPAGNLNILQGAAPELEVVGYKAYYAPKLGAAARHRHVYLYDTANGALSAIIEADFLGMMRTGAASGLATRHLSREESAQVGLFGAGWQARGQLEALCAVRNIGIAKVFSRSPERLQRFCRSMSEELGIDVAPAESAEAAVRGRDIVTTITRSATPVFQGEWVEAGQHINAAGSNTLTRREIDADTVRKCDIVVVDSRDIARNESGDLLPLVEGGYLHWETLVELKDAVAGRAPLRTSPMQVTLFESHGMAVQDLFVAARVLLLARERGLGVKLPIGG